MWCQYYSTNLQFIRSWLGKFETFSKIRLWITNINLCFTGTPTSSASLAWIYCDRKLKTLLSTNTFDENEFPRIFSFKSTNEAAQKGRKCHCCRCITSTRPFNRSTQRCYIPCSIPIHGTCKIGSWTREYLTQFAIQETIKY